MEELLYWITEYGKVFVGYGCLMFLWPMIVFRKFLRGKSATFRFGFCVTGQIVLVNTVILLLGLVHLLNEWTVRLLFYGTLLYSLREYYLPTKERRKKLHYLVNGTFGWKNFLLLERRKLIRAIEKFCKRLGGFYKKHWLEYSVLLISLVYGMIYFSWGVFHEQSYGFGDMYVHHSWIYGLAEGTIFSAGVYPEAMHCVIYSIHALFGVEIYNCMLFLAGIHLVIILVSAYCFMKEIFAWRFSPVFALVLFLTVDVVCVDEVFSMSRLQWTLPQEYGFHTIYLCALFLLRFLSSDKLQTFTGKKAKRCWDENLLIFTLALAASISVHFYVTIMAFFLCAAVALFSLRKIFSKKHFLPLVAGAIAGVFIAVAPMGGALASGIPFQGSIGWAVNVINGTDTGEGRTQAAQYYIENQQGAAQPSEEQQTENIQQNVPGTEQEQLPVTTEPELTFVQRVLLKVKQVTEKIWNICVGKLSTVYSKAYVTLYKGERAAMIVGVSCGVAGLCLIVSVCLKVSALCKKKKRKHSKYTAEYPMIVAATCLFMVLYAAPYLGLPELIAGARLCSNMHLLLAVLVVIPVDMLFGLLAKKVPESVLRWGSAVVAIGIVAGIYASGNYHGYMYFELTRYNGAVAATAQITEVLPKYSYTIVSTTDEQYQVIQNGRHEELLSFLEEDKPGYHYVLPTEYVFIFVEKQPIKYAQNHFFSGPEWLAAKKYQEFYREKSVWPEIIHGEISEEYAAKEMYRFPSKPSLAYSNMSSRVILESKLYKWCETFQKLYPNEMKVFYEDEAFICYYFRQNIQSLYNLNLE
ncbi:MAG: hypothetical protein J6K04_07180 [Lachnospiraceae bacterium]|nr:hypothetical protein [Lachnospiraceae bacterium]